MILKTVCLKRDQALAYFIGGYMTDQYGQQVPYRKDQYVKWDKIDLTTPFYGDISVGNMTRFKIGMFNTGDDRLFVGIEGKQSYTFTSWVHYSYLQEKIGMMEGDAKNMADFINCQLGLFDQGGQQGWYSPELLEKIEQVLVEI